MATASEPNAGNERKLSLPAWHTFARAEVIHADHVELHSFAARALAND